MANVSFLWCLPNLSRYLAFTSLFPLPCPRVLMKFLGAFPKKLPVSSMAIHSLFLISRLTSFL